MIRLNLEVSDPTRADAPRLLALAALFTSLAQSNEAGQAGAALDKTPSGPVIGASGQVLQVSADPANRRTAGEQLGQLDPADNPERGMPSAREVFGRTESAETATRAISREEIDIALGAVALPSPEAAFGGNAGAVPPPPSGPQLSNGATPQTLPPGAPVPPPALPPVATPVPMPGTVSAPAASIGNVPGVELDVEGIPWDASIHASTKVKIANGTWKVKRGTGEAYLLERKALLKAAVSVGNAPVGAPVTPSLNASAPPPVVAGAPGNVPAPAAGATPTPTPSPATTAGTGASSPATLAQVMPRVTAAISAGTLTVDSAAAIVRDISDGKIDNVAMLAVAPALLPAFVARLDALGIPA